MVYIGLCWMSLAANCDRKLLTREYSNTLFHSIPANFSGWKHRTKSRFQTMHHRKPFSNARKQLRKAEWWMFTHTVVERRVTFMTLQLYHRFPLPDRRLSGWLIGNLLPEVTVSHVLHRLIYLLYKHRLSTPSTNVQIPNVIIGSPKDVCRERNIIKWFLTSCSN